MLLFVLDSVIRTGWGQESEAARGDRYGDCRIRTEFAFDRHNCYATGDHKWSSGESRVNTLGWPV